ncbi:family 9 glycoside hydrolase [Nitrospirillum viridazoti Y2]|uniref:Cellulase-like Ig domain-containing protein n=1 Tax=Nitrospirillum amazonense TaxID=28077 RepID=A0A560IXU5_9PROT|nr:glycoside hydrolase family 9 protein [Nitrospirillum amazonense]EGX99527.1 family 9 glycoside hydrolase [Nitrospirillum amazonense Y2]TWB63736.1 cellulase-like Ig domain-containing protein [Nitrospirillum amazonense]
MRAVWFAAALAIQPWFIQSCLAATPPAVAGSPKTPGGGLTVSPNETLEMQGLSVIVDQMHFHPVFRDEKNAGIQIVLHGERIATDGAVRLNPTPEQWDPVPAFVKRERGPGPDQLTVYSNFPEQGFSYRLVITPEGTGFRVAVNMDQPLPAEYVGKAAFSLDFLPTSYFGKTYVLGDSSGLFPRNPAGPMAKDGSGDPLPLASGGSSIVLAPEDPLTRVAITSDTSPLALYDARNRAQNGWFVVRALIPAGKTTDAIVWHVHPNVIRNWVRDPVVAFNQAGYTPDRTKVATVELDPHMKAPKDIQLVRIGADGSQTVALKGTIKPWGKWLRYDYATFDFSSVRTPGIYAISYAGHLFNPFRIAPDAYDHIWQPSLDTYLAEQMDHIAVREQYRAWQGLSHIDDARQAAPNIHHFDGYKMGPHLDSPFKPGEHIPGLNVGGWQDAGDYDIQTSDNAWVVRDLVRARELFGMDWDEDTIDEAARQVEIRKPDGIPDVLQQIRHGTLQLLAQYKVFGHAIVGIIEPTLKEYTHLGDAGSQTDRLIYDPKLGPNESNGTYSGVPDDRWAFTSDVPADDYHVAGALAAASRVLGEIDPDLAAQALAAAKMMWANQQDPSDRMDRPERGDWNPADLIDMAAFSATVDLVITTKGADPLYTNKLKSLLPTIKQRFAFLGGMATLALPYMDADYRAQLTQAVTDAKAAIDAEAAKTPFGVPVAMGTWAGSGQVAGFGTNMYLLHKAFPGIIGTQYTLDALDYVLGRHPATNLSLVSTVGTESKMIAYTHNRADYSTVPGAMVPGVLVIKPDFPEQKVAWPFLWFENESTVATTTSYILAANAGIMATKGQ